jgi:hypothetical protein
MPRRATRPGRAGSPTGQIDLTRALQPAAAEEPPAVQADTRVLAASGLPASSPASRRPSANAWLCGHRVALPRRARPASSHTMLTMTTAISPITRKVSIIPKIQPMAVKATQTAKTAPRIVQIIRLMHPVCARRRSGVHATPAPRWRWIAGGRHHRARLRTKREHRQLQSAIGWSCLFAPAVSGAANRTPHTTRCGQVNRPWGRPASGPTPRRYRPAPHASHLSVRLDRDVAPTDGQATVSPRRRSRQQPHRMGTRGAPAAEHPRSGRHARIGRRAVTAWAGRAPGIRSSGTEAKLIVLYFKSREFHSPPSFTSLRVGLQAPQAASRARDWSL